jgi:hypothetical protein
MWATRPHVLTLSRGYTLKEITVRIVGAVNSVDGYRLRDFLQRSGCRFEWVELGNKDSASAFMGLPLIEEQLPVCILPQGTVLYRPSLQELARALEWFKSPKLAEYDLAIYGAGPSFRGPSSVPSFAEVLSATL